MLPELDVKSMHRGYVAQAEVPCSYELYRRAVRSERIRFARLGKEECQVCTELEGDTLRVHLKEARRCRREYRRDAKSNTLALYTVTSRRFLCYHGEYSD